MGIGERFAGAGAIRATNAAKSVWIDWLDDFWAVSWRRFPVFDLRTLRSVIGVAMTVLH